MTTLEKVENYHTLLDQVRTFLGGRRENNNCTSNAGLLQTYWSIGEYIVLSEQEGNNHATYGIRFLQRMSAHLTRKFGVGFSRSNLIYMRRFFLFFPLRDTFSTKLSWSHYFEILKTNQAAAITFYINQIEKFGWSVRHLKQQIKNGLHRCVTICSYKTPSKPKRPKRISFLEWCREQRKLKLQKAEENSEKRETRSTTDLNNNSTASNSLSITTHKESASVFSQKRETLSSANHNRSSTQSHSITLLIPQKPINNFALTIHHLKNEPFRNSNLEVPVFSEKRETLPRTLFIVESPEALTIHHSP